MKLSKQMILALAKKTLREDQQDPYPTALRDVVAVEPKNVSLDQAIDRYLVRYERESIPTSSMYESAFRKGSLMDLFEANLREQDLPEDDGMDPSADMGGDMGGDDAGGGGGAGPAPATLTKTPRIDINGFAMSIARLVNNFESLIDPKSIILNRAEEYINSNYDQRTGKELLGILKNNYNLEPTTLETSVYGDMDNNQATQPYMVGSGGGGDLTAPSSGGSS